MSADALLAAGLCWCQDPTCREPMWPVSATWLDGPTLQTLALYRCGRCGSEQVWASTLEHRPVIRMCAASTRTGRQCRIEPARGQRLCHVHGRVNHA